MLDTQIQEANIELETVRDDIEASREGFSDVLTEHNKILDQKKSLTAGVEAKKQEKLDADKLVAAAQHTHAIYRDDTLKLERVKADLVNEIEDLNNKKDAISVKYDQLNNTYEELKEDKIKELNGIEHRISVKKQQLIDLNIEDERIRREDAGRKISLDTREENLRLRELKVQQGEEKIIRSSELLNL